eukprot:7398059-Alexandrium_andersonii.AAC.1
MEAWHGCELEALYSTCFRGQLAASQDLGNGERPGFGAGVYVHRRSNAHMAGSYTRYVPLCRDGILWSVKWELV